MLLLLCTITHLLYVHNAVNLDVSALFVNLFTKFLNLAFILNIQPSH